MKVEMDMAEVKPVVKELPTLAHALHKTFLIHGSFHAGRQNRTNNPMYRVSIFQHQNHSLEKRIRVEISSSSPIVSEML